MKMKYRRITALLTVLVFVAFMSGCSKNDGSASDKTKKNNATGTRT